MKLLNLMAFLALVVPCFAQASDNSCFIKQRDSLMAGLGPEYTVTKQTFRRRIGTDQSLDVIEEINFKKGDESWNVTREFSAPENFAQTSVQIKRTVDHMVANVRVSHTIYEVGLTADCSSSVGKTTTYAFAPADSGHTKMIFDTYGISTAPEHSETVYTNDVISNLRHLDLLELEQLSLNRTFTTLNESNAGYDEIKAKLTQNQNQQHLNLLTGSSESMPQLTLKLVGNDSIYVSILRGSSDYRMIVTHIGALTMTEETLPRDEWLKLVPEAGQFQNNIKTVGFDNADAFSPTLRFTIHGHGVQPPVWNPGTYFKIAVTQSGDDWTWTVSDFLPQAPNDIPWNSGSHWFLAGDSKYLRSTEYIQTDKVDTLVKEVRAQLTPTTTRTQAAKIIAKVINNHLQFDYESLHSGIVRSRTTEDILKNGKGVCQHFAIVFAAVARTLGIPTRLIGGFIVEDGMTVGHAWDEIKLGGNQWWPIDSLESESHLLVHTHLPAYVNDAFEFQKGQGNAMIMENAREGGINSIWLNATITKSP